MLYGIPRPAKSRLLAQYRSACFAPPLSVVVIGSPIDEINLARRYVPHFHIGRPTVAISVPRSAIRHQLRARATKTRPCPREIVPGRSQEFKSGPGSIPVATIVETRAAWAVLPPGARRFFCQQYGAWGLLVFLLVSAAACDESV